MEFIKNTISENGYVSRGECFVNKEGYLTNVIERTRIETIDGYLKFEDEKGKMVSIDKETTVSMNIWGFTTNYFEYGEKLFLDFLEKNKENLKAEFYLPFIVNSLLASKKATVKVLKSKAKWFGVTYNEDETIHSYLYSIYYNNGFTMIKPSGSQHFTPE